MSQQPKASTGRLASGEGTQTSREVAAVRLKAWSPELDSRNPAHVDAYILARQNNERVRKERVLEILASQEDSVTRATSQDALFLVVVKTNLPSTLPKHLAEWVVSVEDLQSRFEVRDCDTDWDSVHIFDAGASKFRTELGKFVTELRFSLKSSRRSSAKTGGPTPELEGDRGAPPGGDTGAPTADLDGSGGANLASDGTAPSQKRPLEGEAPSAQARRRKLVERLSESSNDSGESTFAALLTQCEAAAKAGRFCGSDPNSATTVHFWAKSVADALRQRNALPDDQDEHLLVREAFPKLLTKILRSHPCYSDLARFEAIYALLEAKGCQLPKTADPIRKLMLHDVASLTELDLAGVDLDTRRKFYTSPLFASFLVARVPALLSAAKKAAHGPERDHYLTQAAEGAETVVGTNAELKESVAMAGSLFLSTLPLDARVLYAMGDICRVTFAAAWVADFPFGALAFFMEPPPTYSGLTSDSFWQVVGVLVASPDARAEVQNPQMAAILDFVLVLGAVLKAKPWWQVVVLTVAGARLGLLASWGEQSCDWPTIAEDESAEVLLKEMAKLLQKGRSPGRVGHHSGQGQGEEGGEGRCEGGERETESRRHC